jgi:hypothetical protein
MHCTLANSYTRTGQEGHNSLLRSILLRVSPLVTGEDMKTHQVRDEYVLFVTETIRVSVHTAALPSVPSRCHPKTAMLPVGAVHRRTRRTVGWLTGGSGVDMKNECHICCPLIKEYFPCPNASPLWLLVPHAPDQVRVLAPRGFSVSLHILPVLIIL